MAHNKVSQSEADRLISLANGTRVYVLHGDGHTEHLATNSAEFVSAVGTLVAEGHGKRVSTQIDTLASTLPQSSWPEVQRTLATVGVFDN
jgi:hypothetical protein